MSAEAAPELELGPPDGPVGTFKLVVAQSLADSLERHPDKPPCIGLGHVFYPPEHFERKDEKLSREARAKAICRTCVHIIPCQQAGRMNREPAGIWGGENETDRHQAGIPRRR